MVGPEFPAQSAPSAAAGGAAAATSKNGGGKRWRPPCPPKTSTWGGGPARHYSDKEMKLNGCSAFITGASSGIGREFARQLAGRARSLILVARREQRLNELRDELRQRHPNLIVHIRKTDLADLAQLKELIAWLEH